MIEETTATEPKKIRADSDACDLPWCVVHRHAQRFTHAEAKRTATRVDGRIVRLVSPPSRGTDR